MRKDFYAAYDEFNPRPVEQPPKADTPVETFHPSDPAVEKTTEVIIPETVEVVPAPQQEEQDNGNERSDTDNQ